MNNVAAVASWNVSNYPECKQDLGKSVRCLLDAYADKREIPIKLNGMNEYDATQLGLLNSCGRQFISEPIRDTSSEITGWLINFVKI